MHHWMNLFDWMWMGAMMLLWLLVIAVIGYAAVLAAWRHASRGERTHRPKSA